MRKTKIVATIGPASSDPAVFAAMCKAGVNVARLNFSHGTHEEQLAEIDMIKKVREELDLPIAIMLDTKGPEYRIRHVQKREDPYQRRRYLSPLPPATWRASEHDRLREL